MKPPVPRGPAVLAPRSRDERSCEPLRGRRTLAVVLTCPSCARQNPEGFAFCGFCSAALAAPVTPPREERKVVSVLFCDLVGFTARSDAADPEDVRSRIRPYHTRLRTEIERFGGTVEKFIGDAVMAVFGAPVAHEDDAERAVRAGLRILEAIDDLNLADPELGLAVRIGINTGEAVVALGARPGAGEGIVTGDVVNVASRLQTVAPVDGIAVGEPTYRATAAVFDYEQLQPVSVKGKADMLRNWRPIAARARFGTDLTRTHTAALVGRQLETNLLQGTFERAVRDRTVQLITIVGEPGVGKSRQVAELFSYVDDRPDLTRWRQGRCLPYGEGITFWALGEIVKAEAGILESDSDDAASAKLEAAVRSDEADRDWLRDRLGPLVGVDAGPAPEREESFTAWRRFLESLAADGPAVLVFEDLHWADEALLAFLEYLADWSEGVPLLIVGTARPELYERNPDWAGGTRNATTINLAPLSDTDTAHLVSALLDAAVLPPEVQALVIERAGGNPLYAEEFVRMLHDRELLVTRDGTVRLREGADVPFPDSVQAMIAARLDTLAPERKALLQDAAVIGKVFWAGAVASLASREEQTVRNGLHELSRKELVRPARVSSMAGEAEYAFWHLVVRDVCCGQIPRAARAARHRAAAAWIEHQAGARVADLAGVLAHHYVQATELDRAAGDAANAEASEAEARRFLVLAGDRALALDMSQAEASYAQALALTPAGHPERASILERWAGAAYLAGARLQDVVAALEEAIATFRERGEVPHAVRALIALANALKRKGGGRAGEQLAEALELAESRPHGPELVATYEEIAGTKYMDGFNREVVVWAARSLALAAELGLEEPARALGFRGGARVSLGDAGGLSDMRRALELSIEGGRGRDAAGLHNNLAIALWEIEGPASALDACRVGIEFCQRRGMVAIASAIVSSSLQPLYEVGDWDAAADRAREVAGSAELRQDTVDLLEARSDLARLLAQQGEGAAAVSQVEWPLATARKTGDLQALPPAFNSAALAYLRVGELKRSLALLAEVERTPNIRQELYYAAHLPDMVRTALACSDAVLAARLVDRVEPLTPLREHALRAARAALAEAGGALEEAAALYGEAAERWQAFGNVPERGYSLLGQGRCLLELGRAPEAALQLRQAQGIFAGLNAIPTLTQAEALLTRAASETPIPDDTG
jgi:class 3 adenylate cyclase/tetratricopeptide (TPR) repeat protein